MRYSDEYKNLQEKFHTDRPDYGVSGQKYSEHVQGMAKQLKTRDILDYGCGKATLQKSLPFPIQNYDPFMPEYSKRPVPATLVVCTDVLEHIEPASLREVLIDLQQLTLQALFLQVALQPAKKVLPDGRNAHICLQPSHWWLDQLLQHFHLQSFQNNGGEFLGLFTPIVTKEEEGAESEGGEI